MLSEPELVIAEFELVSYVFLPDPEVRDLLHCCSELLLSVNSAGGNFNSTERGRERQ